MPELTKQQIRTIICTEVDDGALFQWRPHFRRLGDVGRYVARNYGREPLRYTKQRTEAK